MIESTPTAQKWALLIGADYYMKGVARLDESGFVIHYPSLGGCVNDVDLVDCFLRDEIGVPGDHIVKLTSSAAEDLRHDIPREDQSLWPTYGNIAQAFHSIFQKGKRGDWVYIHYSGHGARVRTVYESIKGPDGLDEALVPVDIEVISARDQGRYIRDIEIATWIQDMVDKGLRLTVILDSCNAGSANRAMSSSVRGTGVIDQSLLPSDYPTAPMQGHSHRLDASREGRPLSRWLLEASGYTLFAACAAYQKAHEHWFAEKKHGALTYYLIDAFRSEGPIKPSLLMSRVSAMVKSHFSDQTPILDGEDDATFLGMGNRQGENVVRVLTVDEEKQCIELDHGDLHGVHEGAVYAIHSEADGSFDMIVAKARVTRAMGLKATAVIFDIKESKQYVVQSGYKASLLKQAPEKPTEVSLFLRDTAPNTNQQMRWLRAFRDHVDLSGTSHLIWRLLADGISDAAALFITVTDNGCYEVWDASQVPLPNIPPIRAEDPESATLLSGYITHLVKFRLIQRLGADRFSSLNTPCRFELVGKSTAPPEPPSVPNFACDLDFPTGLEPVPLENGTFTVSDNEVISLVFENRGTCAVWFTVFDMEPAWGVSKIYPRRGGWSECVEPGQKRNLPIQMKIPQPILQRGEVEITETLKAIVTLHPTPMAVLQLPDLEDIGRNSTDQDFTSQLDRLMEYLAPYRDARVRQYSTRSWEAHNIVVRTISRGPLL
jgi:hypothetical protein